MKGERTITSFEIREIYQNRCDEISAEKGRKVILSYFGEFSQDLVYNLSVRMEEVLTSSGDNKSVIKRLFSILIEGLQNIRLHGEFDDLGRQLAYVIVSRDVNEYVVSMANLVQKDDAEKIEDYIDKINNLSDEALKEQYMTVLSNEFLSEKGGAGLGFITTRIKSKKVLNFDFLALKSAKLLFTFQVSIDR